MQKPSKSQISIFIAVMLVIAFGAFLLDHFGFDQRRGTTAGLPPVEEVAPEPVGDEEGAEEVTEEGSQESLEPARRIVQVPDTRRQSDVQLSTTPATTEVTAETLVQVTQDRLNRALEGDVDAAIALRYAQWLCLDHFNDKSKLDDMAKLHTEMALARGDVSSQGTTIDYLRNSFVMTIYPTDQQNRQHLVEWFQQCERVRSIFNTDLRTRLEAMAQDGHVMARYLYASWTPRYSMAPGAFENSLEWQMNAINFSYANLDEGEALGLLAFGESYFNFGFTPFSLRLGYLMMAAAESCGLESRELHRQVEAGKVVSSMLGGKDGESAENAAALVAELISYCR